MRAIAWRLAQTCLAAKGIGNMRAVLDHIGIAVRDLDAVLEFYEDALGLEIGESEEIPSQQVRAQFVAVGDVSLELLEATAEKSPIARSIERRGPGLHHITLRVDDILQVLDHLKVRGVRLVDEEPREGAGGSLVAFIHPSAAQGVLVELKQEGADEVSGSSTSPASLTPSGEGSHS